MYVSWYNKLTVGVTVLRPLAGTPHDISAKKESINKCIAENSNTKQKSMSEVDKIKFYLLVQVGGESKDREPFDKHSVVMTSLVSYPVKQL